jgi:hypothetical protein
MVGRGLAMLRPPSSISGVALFALLALGSARTHAQATSQPEVAIPAPQGAPDGFDHQRLLSRVQVYVAPVARVIGASGEPGEATFEDGQPARFVVQLHWPGAAMTPLDARVADTSLAPPRAYGFQVSSAASWDEFERLLALKLLSVLRVALAPPAPAPASAPPEPQPEPAADAPDRSLRPLLEVGGGVATSSALAAARPIGALRFALASGSWAFGVATTLTFRSAAAGADARSEVLETTWAASLRHEWLPAHPSRWVVQLGAELGVFAARVAGERLGQERTAYAVSPLASALVLGGYRLIADGSAVLLCGPAVDLLFTRSELTAAAAQLYDSGHIRLRGELKLVLAF